MANIGRNSLCPCNSGKKFKHCCGADSSPVVESTSQPIPTAQNYFEKANYFQSIGRYKDAIAGYEAALSLNRNLAEAHFQLAHAHRAIGNISNAGACYLAALSIKESEEAKAGFLQCVTGFQFNEDYPVVRKYLLQAISTPWCRPGELARTAISLIKVRPSLKKCISLIATSWPDIPALSGLTASSAFAEVCEDELLRCLMESAIVCDIELEKLLTLARYYLLETAVENPQNFEVQGNKFLFYCALARQCFNNEYIFDYTETEYSKAKLLQQIVTNTLLTGQPVAPVLLIALAGYFPLCEVPGAERLLDSRWPDALSAILTQQIREPFSERAIMGKIKDLTVIEGDVSLLVKEQYESNPYPKWIRTQRSAGRSFNVLLRQTLPFAVFQPLPEKPVTDVLIAGCGTGQQSIETAHLISNSKLLAVDLSKASLAYAIRKTQEYNLQNIEYACADLLKMGGINRQFDVIHAGGVLHHLEDPLVGWRVLRSLLRDGGFMRIALYSKLARRKIAEAQRLAASQAYGSIQEGIHGIRQLMMSDEHRAKFSDLMSFQDFFVASEVRDFLFHAQEHQLTLPEIKGWIEDMDLTFLGFQLPQEIIAQYRNQFPGDKTLTNLDCWSAYEESAPDTFLGMYQFYVQADNG